MNNKQWAKVDQERWRIADWMVENCDQKTKDMIVLFESFYGVYLAWSYHVAGIRQMSPKEEEDYNKVNKILKTYNLGEVGNLNLPEFPVPDFLWREE